MTMTSTLILDFCTFFSHLCTSYSTFFRDMVRTNKKMEHFDELKKEYIEALPEIDALKQQLKICNKAQKERHEQIYSYMRDHNLMSADIGGVTFEREEKNVVSVSMKTLEEIIENPAELEQYKRDHTTTKETLKVRKPKRRRGEEE